MRDEFLTIDLAPFVRLTKERMDHLAAARDLLVSDPDILRGTLVIRETGIPAFGIVASVATSLPMDRILAANPSLDAVKVEIATIYAEISPAQGGPRSS